MTYSDLVFITAAFDFSGRKTDLCRTAKAIYTKATMIYRTAKIVYIEAMTIYGAAKPVYIKAKTVYIKAKLSYMTANAVYIEANGIDTKAKGFFSKETAVSVQQYRLRQQALVITRG